MIGPRDAARGAALEHPWSVAVAATIVAVAIALFIPLSRMDEWVGWLPGTVSIFESLAIVLPTYLAALSAWVSGQARAHRMSDWVAATPTTLGRRLAPALVIAGTSAVVADVVTVVALFAVSERFGLRGGWASPDLIIVIPTVAVYVGIWVVVGAWVGVAVRRDVAIPIAALLPYFWYAISVSLFAGTPIEALAVGDPGTFDFLRPTEGAVVLRCLTWLTLLVLLCSAIAGARRAARLSAWVLSALVAASIVVGPRLEPIPGATDAVCAGGAPKACLESSYRTTMSRYREAIDEVWPSIPRALRPAVVASNVTVAPPGELALIVPPVSASYLAPARLIDQRHFSAWLGDELFLAPCRGKERSDAALTLIIWWRLDQGIPLDGSNWPGDTDFAALVPNFDRLHRVAVEFTARPQADQELWFDHNSDGVRTCTAPNIGT